MFLLTTAQWIKETNRFFFKVINPKEFFEQKHIIAVTQIKFDLCPLLSVRAENDFLN